MDLKTKLDEMRKRCKAADRLVCDLASGKKKWNMCIPAQEDDTDFVLVNPLREMPLLISALEVCLGALEDCTGGDLASGEGIYKAEVARIALAKAEALLVGEGKDVR